MSEVSIKYAHYSYSVYFLYPNANFYILFEFFGVRMLSRKIRAFSSIIELHGNNGF
jgi:hypothetical protein